MIIKKGFKLIASTLSVASEVFQLNDPLISKELQSAISKRGAVSKILNGTHDEFVLNK